MKKYKASLKVIVAVLLLTILIFFKNYKIDFCLLAVDQYVCYGNQMQGILKTKGVDASIQYVKSVVLVNHGYNLAHILLHAAGEAAYYKEGRDIKKTAAYLKPYIRDQTNEEARLNGFDGYYHGAISAYFEDRSGNESLPKLISNICEGSFNILDIMPHSFECYHTIGHALMHAQGNKTHDSLKICEKLDRLDSQEGCYYGVFMENSFLYVPLYHKGMVRPDVKGSSILSVCQPLSGVQKQYCSFYVGQVYLSTHPGQIRGAFDECRKLKLKSLIAPCIYRLGFVYIPQSDPGDYEKLIKICEYAGDEYRKKCIDSFSEAYKMGYRKTTKEPLLKQFANFWRNIN